MPRASPRLPLAEHLAAEPHLATVTLLETTVNVAILSLGTAYPELATLNVEPYEPLELLAAADLIERARDLDAAIARYRRDLTQRHDCERAEEKTFPSEPRLRPALGHPRHINPAVVESEIAPLIRRALPRDTRRDLPWETTIAHALRVADSREVGQLLRSSDHVTIGPAFQPFPSRQ